MRAHAIVDALVQPLHAAEETNDASLARSPRLQLTLAFLDTPAPTEAIWKTLDPITKNAALQALARTPAQAVLPPRGREQRDD